VPSPACPDESILLSAEQESYLSLDRNGHGAVPICFRVRGKLDIPALQRALARVMARHEPLRMRLLDTPEGPRQLFPPTEAEDCMVQVRSAADGRAAEDVARELAITPSDVRAHGPVRTWLIRSGPADMLLLVLIDHLALDAWSASVFVRELWICYYAAVTGTEPMQLPPVPRFTDFVAAQHAAASTWEPAQYKHWRRVSRDYCEPVARPPAPAPVGPPDQPGRSDLVCVLPAEQMDRLIGFARAAAVPPRTVELAGPLLALWAWCPTPLINAWCLHSGREDPTIANAIGNYAKNFPLVVRVDPAATLAEFTRNVLRGWSDAVAYSGPPYTTPAMRQMIAQAGGADPAMPEVRLNRIIPPRGLSRSGGPVPVSESATIEFCDLEVARWSWYREPRLRLMSTFDKSLFLRAIFNPGLTPPDFAETLMARLNWLLPQFVSEHANHPIGELVGQLAGAPLSGCPAHPEAAAGQGRKEE
jgi:Condensation domain